MRLFMINVLASAMLLTVATQASAVSITQTGTGGSYNVSDTITLNYYLNTIGDPGLAVIAFSVSFDNTVLAPDLVNSLTKNKILKGIIDEGGNPNNNYNGMVRLSKVPTLQGLNDELLFAWSGGTAAAWTEVTSQLVGTAIFHAISSGVSNIDPLIGQGSNFTIDSGTYTTAGVAFADLTGSVGFFGGGSITVVPEPTTALLIGLGLVGLGVAGSRGRQER